MNAHVHPNVVMKPAAVAEWENCGTSIVVAGRCWPADDWRELVLLWSRGISRRPIDALYLTRGYTEIEIENMRALLAGNPFILPPVERALFVLGGLAARDDRVAGGFTLNGRPARAVDVVHAANRTLCPLALPQIRYPSPSSGAGGCEA